MNSLPPLLQTELEIEAGLDCFRDLYKSSLYHTAKFLLGYKDMTRRTHGDMIKCLESPTKRKLIVMPRGTFKSSISVVAYSIWLLMNDPDHRILIDSELYTNSKNFLREIKVHLKSKEFIELFGDWEGPVWTESEIIIAPRKKILKDASIKCTGTGATVVGAHFDTCLCDDLNSDTNSQTPELRQKVIDHYRMLTAILEPNTSRMVVVGTRYATNDLLGHILENEVGDNGLLAKS